VAAGRYRRPVSVPDPERDRVLRIFFVGERLATMPRRGRKRRIVLEHLAGWFEPGRRYSEAEVNDRLRVAHPDVAALRRYLVDEELLDRDADSYWRCGGPVDVDEQ
jgi:hypothetical protein